MSGVGQAGTNWISRFVIKKICKWLYWRTHEINLGATPYRPDYPNIGELFRMDPAIYVVTRVIPQVMSSRLTMYQIYGVHLGHIMVDMPSCCGASCDDFDFIGDCTCVIDDCWDEQRNLDA